MSALSPEGDAACPSPVARRGHQRWHGWGSLLGLLVLLLSLAGLPALPPAAPLAPTHPPGPLAVALRGAPSLLVSHAALAGPVEWREVPETPEGRQWWDAGSLRRDRSGRLSVLSRFQPAAADAGSRASASDPGTAPSRTGSLYVMELDCDRELYRDISVNGLPRWRPAWVAAADDALSLATVRAACAAASSAAA